MKIWMIFICCTCTFKGFTQVNPGARLTSIGNSLTAVSDVWNIQGNPSGITGVKRPFLALNYVNNLLSEALATQSVVFVVPFRNNFTGFSFQRYGFNEYTNIYLGFDYAKKLEQLSIGISSHFSQTKIEGYGATRAFAISAGVQYCLNKRLTLGSYITYPVTVQMNNIARQAIPFTLSAGITYQSNNKVMVSCSFDKTSQHGIITRIGIDYELITNFSLRAGLSTSPFRQYTGFGFNYRSFSLNTALTKDPNLSYSPQIEIGYAF